MKKCFLKLFGAFTIICVTFAAEKSHTTFKVFDINFRGNKKLESFFFSSEKASKFQCAHICMQQVKCYGFNFDGKVCELFSQSQFFGEQPVRHEGWEIYLLESEVVLCFELINTLYWKKLRGKNVHFLTGLPTEPML